MSQVGGWLESLGEKLVSDTGHLPVTAKWHQQAHRATDEDYIAIWRKFDFDL